MQTSQQSSARVGRQVELSDQRVVDIRPLERRDREGLADAIGRLSS